jgi:hypothetical protein
LILILGPSGFFSRHAYIGRGRGRQHRSGPLLGIDDNFTKAVHAAPAKAFIAQAFPWPGATLRLPRAGAHGGVNPREKSRACHGKTAPATKFLSLQKLIATGEAPDRAESLVPPI